MKIAVEAFWLNTKELTGVGYYILNVLKEINNQNSGNTYYLLYTGERWIGPDMGSNFVPVCYGKGRATFAIWFNLHKVIKKLKPDIYHATFPTRVPPQKLPCPTITTVCDLLALHIESFWNRLVFKLTTHWAWKNSNHFLCISNYTANEIVAYKNISLSKISVTYLAPAHKIQKWIPPGKHLLFVGSLTHRKNPLLLISAYKKLCSILSAPPPLLIVGFNFGFGKEFLEAIQFCPDNGTIKWLEYVDTKTLSELYADAAIYILPSKLEGFGMPAIEAMASGVPVMCSDIQIFHEIGGDCIEYVTGWNPDVWAEQIKGFLLNTEKREQLSEKGRLKAKEYTWDKCAKETYSIFRKFSQGNNS